MPARIFQPFKRVWTPRTPDSSYDSLGIYPPPSPIVMTPLLNEGLGTGVSLLSAAYYAATAIVNSTEVVGYGLSIVSITYTPPS